MRIANQKVTVSSVLFGKVSAVFYLLVTAFFVYKCLTLLPVWLTAKAKAEDARLDYEKKTTAMESQKEFLRTRDTDAGRERYEKDFFNKLDPGENLIILYENNKEETYADTGLEAPRKMFWWETWEQDFLVWWRNLKL